MSLWDQFSNPQFHFQNAVCRVWILSDFWDWPTTSNLSLCQANKVHLGKIQISSPWKVEQLPVPKQPAGMVQHWQLMAFPGLPGWVEQQEQRKWDKQRPVSDLYQCYCQRHLWCQDRGRGYCIPQKSSVGSRAKWLQLVEYGVLPTGNV